MRATLDRQGRVSIPKQLREELHLVAGSRLALARENGELRLRPLKARQALTTVKGGVLVYSGVATGDVAATVRRQRSARLRKLAARMSR